MDEILEALISKEALPVGASDCRHCKNAIAGWRCKDCVLATPLCRACMRIYHRENPFHRIEHWNGSYYRPAALSEVGTYLLVQHHTGDPICERLRNKCNLIDSAEETKDKMEQEQLRISMPVPVPVSEMDQYLNDMDMDLDMDRDVGGSNDDNLYDGDDGDEELEATDEYDSAGHDIGIGAGPGPVNVPHPAIRVVHSNGLHHIGMVTCVCHGENNLHLDLFAAQLLPASFKRIRTLFTAQVLDMFRLCNLELKASAYQFYQLLRRLTSPMAPADVLNLYREFRRMSRIWRWIKKLKWAGYAGGNKSVKKVKPGELTIYCPACPQPGVNIPDNWKDDSAKWVYKRIFVADGNFKADHVRQKNEVDDVWLSEGSGMIPQRQEYLTFLATAIERLTVSIQLSRNPAPVPVLANYFWLEGSLRKHI
jgi:hypothetical protein